MAKSKSPFSCKILFIMLIILFIVCCYYCLQEDDDEGTNTSSDEEDKIKEPPKPIIKSPPPNKHFPSGTEKITTTWINDNPDYKYDYKYVLKLVRPSGEIQGGSAPSDVNTDIMSLSESGTYKLTISSITKVGNKEYITPGDSVTFYVDYPQ